MKVFLSSTGRDLKAYREAAFNAIQGLHLHCVRMEDFHGPDIKIEDFDDQRIDECDLFVIILGHLHGTCPEGSEKSYTELEYETAQRLKKPCFLFLAPEDFSFKANLIEGEDKRTKQHAFRDRAVKGVIRNTFNSPEDLAAQIAQAIHVWRHPPEKSTGDHVLDSPGEHRTFQTNCGLEGTVSSNTPIKIHQRFWDTNLFWGCFGTGIGLFGLAAGFLMPGVELARWALVIAWVAFTIAICAAFRGRFMGRIKWYVTSGLGSIIIAVGLFGMFIHYKKPPVVRYGSGEEVYSQFADVYRDGNIGEKLGRPYKHNPPNGFYEARYERARAIWVLATNTWYILFDDGTSELRADHQVPEFNDYEYIKRNAKALFGPVRHDSLGKCLPKFGMAKILSEDRALFKRTGLRMWDCDSHQFPGGSTSLQQFENGIMIGPLHALPSITAYGNAVSILTKGVWETGFKWKETTIPKEQPACEVDPECRSKSSP